MALTYSECLLVPVALLWVLASNVRCEQAGPCNCDAFGAKVVSHLNDTLDRQKHDR